jgi:4-hydroxy-tetrahydrodipicolinate reductase
VIADPTKPPSGRLRIALLGGSGRMGRALVAALDEAVELALAGASCSPGSRWAGRDIAEAVGGRARGVTLRADPAEALANAQVAVDFALPEATSANLRACVAAGTPLVLGATGHAQGVREEIAGAARHIPIVMAPNMSLGVNLLLKLVEVAARSLDAGYDVEVFEAHHRNKKDAPSGTALALGRAAADGRNVKFEDAAEYARQGATDARRSGAIGFSVFRGGDVVGDHTVTFAGLGERIELTHRASDRLAFARGALKAAAWIAGREPGLYSMQDVLGLQK